MPNSFYDRELATVTRKLTAEDYEKSWILREKAIGDLRDNRLFTILFSVLGIAFLMLKIPDLAQFHWEPAIVGLLEFLFCTAGVIYQQMIVPQRVQSTAVQLFRTNRVLQQEETITLTRDGFTLRNKCEALTGFWSETAYCLESSDFFIFCGGLDRETLIVPKSEMDAEAVRRVSDKMQETFAGRYKFVR